MRQLFSGWDLLRPYTGQLFPQYCYIRNRPTYLFVHIEQIDCGLADLDWVALVSAVGEAALIPGYVLASGWLRECLFRGLG